MRKHGIIIMLLLSLLTVVTACSSNDESTTGPQPTESNNVVTVIADGNVDALSHVKLTFGSGGRVASVVVKEGDKVSMGQVLAVLDTRDLELAEAQAQAALAQAQSTLDQAKLAGQNAAYNLKNTQDEEGTLELALANAQIGVRTARLNLEQTSDLYTWSDVKIAKADVDDSQRQLDDLLEKAGEYLTRDKEGNYPTIEEYIFSEDFPKGPGYEGWQEELVHAQARLNTAKDRLDAMLSGSDPEEVAIKKLQLEAAEQAETQARKKLEDLSEEIALREMEVESARQSLEYAAQNVDLAQKSLIKAEKDLEEATITAPFDGVVARVGVKEGEYLSPAAYAGTTVVELIDPGHMEITARVNEIDVVRVKTGQKVIISVNAMPEVELEGLVTYVSLVARQPGAVLFEDEDEEKEYEVKIDFNIPENSPIRAGMSATTEIIVETL